MKLLHVADTHLGYSAYRKTTKDGINQREMDVYSAFNKFVDYAIKKNPDLIIHAGDFFDSVRPNNRAITFAVNQLIRLSEKEIPTIILSGNHEQPKLKETGHIFSVFDHIKNIYPVYRAGYETHEFEIDNNKIIIHSIPQCNNKKEFNEEFKKIKPVKKTDLNFLTTHGAVTKIKEFTMNEFNELIIPSKILDNCFDYIALGHYHKYTKLAENTFYSGAIESLNFSEASEKKGFIELKILDNKINHNFVEIKTRSMIDVKPIKCSEMKIDEIMKKIKNKIIEIEPEDKIFRITLNDIPAHVYRSLDFREIRKLNQKTIHYEIKADVIKDEKSGNNTSSKINALANEYKTYLDSIEIKEKETLYELGIEYIAKIEAREERR
jgi:DNA repair exonuclease SbcCD nuclease subunit